MNASSHRLGAVLVNYRSIDDVRRVLTGDALVGADQVVLVDNGDEPDAVADLAAQHGCTPVLLTSNRGFAGGVNAGVAALNDEIDTVLLLNPDVTTGAEELRKLHSVLRTSGADGVAPVLKEPSGRIQIGSAGGPLTLVSFTAYFLMLSQVLPIRGIFLTRRQTLRANRVDWLCMACLLVRRDAFKRFGPVPEDEIVYAEDIAWGTHASSQGAHFRVVPQVAVVHRHGSSGASSAWAGSLERLARRRLGGVQGALAVRSMRIGLAARRCAGRQVGAARSPRSSQF